MKIPVKVSEIMSVFSEDGVIRVPRDARDIFMLELNRYVHTRNRSNDLVSFKLDIGYGRDAARDSTSCYISQSTYDSLNVDNASEVFVRTAEEVTLGCDPEFFLVNSVTKNIMQAYKVFKNKNGDVGFDGTMAELRPQPSLHEHAVCDNLWKLIQKARLLINENYKGDPNEVRMIATSFLPIGQHSSGYSAGFHLHYGLPTAIIGNVSYKNPKSKIAQQIIKVLDFYVGIPSVMAEENSESHRRSDPDCQYGKPGGFRMDNRTLEYRTPGASLLKHPTLTVGLLGIGALVVQDLMIKISDWTESFTRLDQVVNADIRDCYPNVPKNILEVHRAICSPNNITARGYLEAIANDLSEFHGFEKRKRSVETLLSVLEQSKTFDMDLERNWGEHYNEKQKGQMGFRQ